MAGSSFVPKSVLLTGGAGFIGSHVLERLVLDLPETEFVCLDCLDYVASMKNLDAVRDLPRFTFVKGDIRSADLVSYILEKHQCDTIYHFAAESHVDNSFLNSVKFTQTNIVGTHVLLECAKKVLHQIKRFIYVSTDEVYGENRESQIADASHEAVHDENFLLQPTNPYSATKCAAEHIVRAFYISFHMPIIITRGNNVYGPRQYPEKLIPKFINLLERKQKCPIHGDGSHRRSFLFVEDVAEAYKTVLLYGRVGETYNIAHQFEVTNLEVGQQLAKLFGRSPEEAIYFVRDRDYNDRRYKISHEKIKSLGWEPKTSFEDGLRKTIDWYRKHEKHWTSNIENVLTPHPVRQRATGFGDLSP
uniref:NAD(P)-binding domain-containing protein n=1 Tax=Chromera velia CCMP2878 TaxID=1169474 RepID=A0A0G4HZ67_9ALVE|mmetsp:Transcript_11937/g.22914  ORF Transcript_11937/g.22914 Transcript_11937/m.22914 type:complete len:361 (-) Transcript_11937:32-1114(-)|eukprot:Cvel_9654.t1-p1 / transcript=Cvel_9654.t1 / gene=Cvel_9654 / organism=Chromera_velia_CCMP2878 / gene_product=Probable rhamnose biosynthetic enzyme 2, putative / transcript_product=Probable rhamnose biosynthetic enzyme 2, putative / location=Cvel_scaffold562:5655-10376(+) / protein_length=360 / sequence_SO=supercontig / SO=protein_coding / is_pseudo=false